MFKIDKNLIPYHIIEDIVDDEFVNVITVLDWTLINSSWIECAVVYSDDIKLRERYITLGLANIFNAIYYELLWASRYREKCNIIVSRLDCISSPEMGALQQIYETTIPFRAEFSRYMKSTVLTFDVLFRINSVV